MSERMSAEERAKRLSSAVCLHVSDDAIHCERCISHEIRQAELAADIDARTEILTQLLDGSWQVMSHGITKAVADIEEAAAEKAREDAIEECAKWHDKEAKDCEERANRVTIESSEVLLREERLVHIGSAALLRALKERK